MGKREYKTTISIGGKVNNSLDRAMKAAESKSAKTAMKIGGKFKSATKMIAKVAAVGATALAASAVAFTGVAVKNAAAMQSQMQNVATLLDGSAEKISARTTQLSKEVIEVSNRTGIATEDLTAGLYDVISAVGDSKDSTKILEIAAKAAAAGNAETSESVALLTAVTKGYGDTSGEAFNKVSDLAFQTVKLGQTTFPELAASIGKVTPLASALGVKQEELFGVFATLTGVTGTAAEVSTQYKGVLAGLMSPSKSMAEALKKLGYSTGSAAIESMGFNGVMKALMKTTDGDVQKMAKLFSSVEAQTAVLALGGAQADTFNNKMAAMQSCTGATDEAFRRQTDTLEYSIQRMKNLGINFATSVGTMILPYLNDAAEYLLPKISSGFEYLLPKVEGLIQRCKPVIGLIGEIGTSVKDVISMIINGTPAIDALGISLTENFGLDGNTLVQPLRDAANAISPLVEDGIAIFKSIGPVVKTYALGVFDGFKEKLPGLKAVGKILYDVAVTGFGTLRTVIEQLAPYATSFFATVMPMMATVSGFISTGWQKVSEVIRQNVLPAFDNMINGIMNGVTPILSALQPIFSWIVGAVQSLIPILQPIVSYLIEKIGNNISFALNALGIGFNIAGNVIAVAINTIKTVIGGLYEHFSAAFESIKGVFDGIIQFVTGVFTGNWQKAWDGVTKVFESVFGGIRRIAANVLNTVIRTVNGVINGINSITKAIPGGGSIKIPVIPEVALAKGATVTSPTVALIGEGSDAETVVPHNNSPRSRSLLREAAQGVYGKHSVKTSKTEIVYAPVINGSGNVAQDLKEDFERFKRYFEQKEKDDDREVFA